MPTHCPTCRVKRRYRKKRAAFCTSIPTHPGQFDSQFEHQVSIGFKRIDYRTVRAQVKRRHRFENSTASKRRRLLSAMKKGHGEKQFAGCHLRQSPRLLVRPDQTWSVNRTLFLFFPLETFSISHFPRPRGVS